MNEFYNKAAESFADAVMKHPKIAFGVSAVAVAVSGVAVGKYVGKKLFKNMKEKEGVGK